jgi:uncharacterized membrane protein
VSAISGKIKNLGRNLNLKSSKNAYAVSVAIALLIASVLLGVYYVALRPVQAGYFTIYLLDSQKKAIDYPEVLVSGVNSTFSVYVEVENHNGTDVNCTVQVKVTSDMNPTYPVAVNANQTFTSTVKNGGEPWENVATVTLNQPGDYMVIFELWTITDGAPQFSGEFTQLNIHVAD